MTNGIWSKSACLKSTTGSMYLVILNILSSFFIFLDGRVRGQFKLLYDSRHPWKITVIMWFHSRKKIHPWISKSLKQSQIRWRKWNQSKVLNVCAMKKVMKREVKITQAVASTMQRFRNRVILHPEIVRFQDHHSNPS